MRYAILTCVSGHWRRESVTGSGRYARRLYLDLCRAHLDADVRRRTQR